MNNKKLLKFILRDLSELEELITDKAAKNFDELEWEFLQTRVGGAKRMIGILIDRENKNDTKKEEVRIATLEENIPTELIPREKPEKIPVQIDDNQEINGKEEKQNVKEKAEEIGLQDKEDVMEEEIEEAVKSSENISEVETEAAKSEDLELNKKDTDEKRPTLGDSFSKEKSINDLVDSDKTNLEQKLSNRPVNNIKTSIGINDRFQFIRELFDGNPDTFSKAVAELDNKRDIKEAVEYLQTNFKWKKNETSLKFVNLVKRRFSND